MKRCQRSEWRGHPENSCCSSCGEDGCHLIALKKEKKMLWLLPMCFSICYLCLVFDSTLLQSKQQRQINFVAFFFPPQVNGADGGKKDGVIQSAEEVFFLFLLSWRKILLFWHVWKKKGDVLFIHSDPAGLPQFESYCCVKYPSAIPKSFKPQEFSVHVNIVLLPVKTQSRTGRWLITISDSKGVCCCFSLGKVGDGTEEGNGTTEQQTSKITVLVATTVPIVPKLLFSSRTPINHR